MFPRGIYLFRLDWWGALRTSNFILTKSRPYATTTGPFQSLLIGRGRLTSYVYVGDCMLTECPIGNRLSSRASCWEWSCRKVLGNGSIDDEKKGIHRRWPQKQTLLGFGVDTGKMIVRLPDEEILHARSLVLIAEAPRGNYGIRAKALQKLRGFCLRLLTCNLFWRFLCRPIDLLLSHVIESGRAI